MTSQFQTVSGMPSDGASRRRTKSCFVPGTGRTTHPWHVAVLLGLAWLAAMAQPDAASRGGPASDVVPDAAPAVEPKIDGWVRDLADKQYAVRQRAADELRKIGCPAVPALERAAQSDDPEVADVARAILKDARLGVSAAWPKALAQDLRQYETMTAVARDAFIRQVISEMRAEAVPFLLVRLAFGDAQEAQSVLNALSQSKDDRMAERLVATLKTPGNEWQARALAWAHLTRKEPQAALRVLAAGKVKDDALRSVIQQIITDLLRQFAKEEYKIVAMTAGEAAAIAPDEPRLLYLQALALRLLGKEKEPAELEKKALELNPREEGPHYSAGDMLMDLGANELSQREWETILKIPPADDVYDINAHMRLGQLAAHDKRNGEAAEHYEAGLKLYRQNKAAGHGGYGMVGTSEMELEATIRHLRQGKGPGKAMIAGDKGKQITLHITPVVKDRRQKALQAALKACRLTLTANVEPLGVRLLDLKDCRLAYDRDTEKISILLHETAACDAQRCRLGGKKANIAVCSLDCVYIYELDPAAGNVTRLDRFEKDYEVKVVPDESLRAFKGDDLKIGDTMYPWKDLLEGTTLDYLPPILEFKLVAPAADGEPETLKFAIPINEAGL